MPYTYAGVVDVNLNIPDFIKDNFTDLQIVHMLDETSATMPWCETVGDKLHFQAESFSKFVIIGTALDPNYGSTEDSGDAPVDDNIVDDNIADVPVDDNIVDDNIVDVPGEDVIIDTPVDDAPIGDIIGDLPATDNVIGEDNLGEGTIEENIGIVPDDGIVDDSADIGEAPITGENGITVPVLMFLVAAAYVIISAARKKVK